MRMQAVFRGSLAVAALVAAGPALAQDSATVLVLDRSGNPLPDVLVFADVPAPAPPQDLYVMDQVDLAFEPEVLVVPPGARVSFPNSDPVAHHVYSFSRPNNFVLPLYRGQLPAPVAFEHEGVVVIGCNIHDHMVGHIIVTALTPQGRTNADGRLRFAAPAGRETTVRIWNPRIRGRGEATVKTVGADGAVTFRLSKRLLAARDRSPTDDY